MKVTLNNITKVNVMFNAIILLRDPYELLYEAQKMDAILHDSGPIGGYMGSQQPSRIYPM
jgi:hypothetical protein